MQELVKVSFSCETIFKTPFVGFPELFLCNEYTRTAREKWVLIFTVPRSHPKLGLVHRKGYHLMRTYLTRLIHYLNNISNIHTTCYAIPFSRSISRTPKCVAVSQTRSQYLLASSLPAAAHKSWNLTKHYSHNLSAQETLRLHYQRTHTSTQIPSNCNLISIRTISRMLPLFRLWLQPNHSAEPVRSTQIPGCVESHLVSKAHGNS